MAGSKAAAPQCRVAKEPPIFMDSNVAKILGYFQHCEEPKPVPTAKATKKDRKPMWDSANPCGENCLRCAYKVNIIDERTSPDPTLYAITHDVTVWEMLERLAPGQPASFSYELKPRGSNVWVQIQTNLTAAQMFRAYPLLTGTATFRLKVDPVAQEQPSAMVQQLPFDMVQEQQQSPAEDSAISIDDAMPLTPLGSQPFTGAHEMPAAVASPMATTTVEVLAQMQSPVPTARTKWPADIAVGQVLQELGLLPLASNPVPAVRGLETVESQGEVAQEPMGVEEGPWRANADDDRDWVAEAYEQIQQMRETEPLTDFDAMDGDLNGPMPDLPVVDEQSQLDVGWNQYLADEQWNGQPALTPQDQLPYEAHPAPPDEPFDPLFDEPTDMDMGMTSHMAMTGPMDMPIDTPADICQNVDFDTAMAGGLGQSLDWSYNMANSTLADVSGGLPDTLPRYMPDTLPANMPEMMDPDWGFDFDSFMDTEAMDFGTA